ncbi:hypothetical protein PAXRUDRAFT_149909, partial [Paxillus rubicundulus Ve08.2h10]
PLTFESCSTCICGEASCQLNEKTLAGPGSGYVHIASAGSFVSANINPITSLQKHPKNPQGIFCTMSVCSVNHHGDHDQPHCFSPEDQVPWQKKKKKEGTSSRTPTPTRSGASTPVVSSSSLPAVSAAAITSMFLAASGDTLCGDLSYASINPMGPSTMSPELAAHIHSSLSTILDSGTTTTLVHDHAHFQSFSQDPSATV